MNSKIKFYFAVFIARCAMFALKLTKRNGTHFPGVLILKFCPDFLSFIAMPPKCVAITGTNGKTTTTNFVYDMMAQTNIKIAHNTLGSNIQEGIFVTFLKSTNFWGTRSKVDLMILEVDERVSPKIYAYLKPNWLIVTNLFRDSYRRNAHVEFIVDILNQTIPSTTKLIVNTDDVISSYLCPDNDRIGFSVARLEQEPEVRDSLIKDIVYCPVCDNKLTFGFNRYHHLGQVYCLNCHFQNLKPQVTVIKVDTLVHIQVDDMVYLFPKPGNNITDYYNMVAALTFMLEYGLDMKQLQTYFANLKVVKTRFVEVPHKGKNIILMMAKDQNPVAVSRVFDYIRRQNTRTCAVIFINENSEHHTGSENVAYYFDADFEYLNQAHIIQVIGGGHRIIDLRVRCLMAGIQDNRFRASKNELRTAELVDLHEVQDVYVLYGTKTEAEAIAIRARLIQRIEQEVKA